MPLAWGDDVIGWVNCARVADGLNLQAGYIATRDHCATFASAFDEEAARFEAFLRSQGTGRGGGSSSPIVDPAAGT